MHRPLGSAEGRRRLDALNELDPELNQAIDARYALPKTIAKAGTGAREQKALGLNADVAAAKVPIAE